VNEFGVPNCESVENRANTITEFPVMGFGDVATVVHFAVRVRPVIVVAETW
jgi:hypothetical protein